MSFSVECERNGLDQVIAAMLPNTVYDESSSLVPEPILPVAMRRGLLSGNALPTRIIEQYTEKAKVSKASWIEQESIVAIIFLVAFGRFALRQNTRRGRSFGGYFAKGES